MEKQKLSALQDVSALFESYFSTFIRDKEEFSDDLTLKCLGIIAFFHALPYKDRAASSAILNNFGIAYEDFISRIEKLDRLEVVERQYDYIKIPEQNLSTYFFYLAFIKKELLSFETLLCHHFAHQKPRFIETISATNQIFNYKGVKAKIQPILRNHWKKIRDIEGKNKEFLNVFCWYLREETLEYVLE